MKMIPCSRVTKALTISVNISMRTKTTDGKKGVQDGPLREEDSEIGRGGEAENPKSYLAFL